jgi:transposase-like protein
VPYKSEKIKIDHTQHDKRIRLSEEQKQAIRKEYATGLATHRSLAEKYRVNRKTIYNILNHDKYLKQLEENKINKHSKKYYQKEKHREYIKIHRRYKQKLYINKEIGDDYETFKTNKILDYE